MSSDPTRPLERVHTDAELEIPPAKEVDFEEARGITQIEVRAGFAGIQVQGISDADQSALLGVLERVANAGVSIDFLKLTQDGISFLVQDGQKELVEVALKESGTKVKAHAGRSVVLVHAANMRDEEGLIARIVSAAIGSGAEIDHMGDMHDRILLVVSSKDAEALALHLHNQFGGSR